MTTVRSYSMPAAGGWSVSFDGSDGELNIFWKRPGGEASLSLRPDGGVEVYAYKALIGQNTEAFVLDTPALKPGDLEPLREFLAHD